MVHLIGIAHSFEVCAAKPFRDSGLEIAGSSDIARQFESYLNKVVERLKPRAICEEYSEACLLGQLEVDDQAYLVAQRVCNLRSEVTHVFCDPDQSERESLYAAHGTTETEDERNGYPIREGEWLRRLLPHVSGGVVLFLCGANHISTFSQRLLSAGIHSSVICENFELEINESGSKSSGRGKDA